MQYASLLISIKSESLFIHSFYLVTRYCHLQNILIMKTEINVALDLLCSYVERYGSIKEESIEQFRTQLEKVLLERYQGHWYAGKDILHLI